MPKTELATCDVCAHEWVPDRGRWYQNSNGGKVTIVPDGINGQLGFEVLCPSCRTAIYNAVTHVVRERRPTKEVSA